jgi:peptidoglycan/LPS O-acetylase OafA/YrhL
MDLKPSEAVRAAQTSSTSRTSRGVPGPHIAAVGPVVDGASERVGELDSLRGIACLVVLFYHLKPHLLPIGWAAVDLFFVLSGYLITRICLREGGGTGFLRAFYARRALRIFPIYYLAIFAVVALGPWLPERCYLDGLPWYLTYTQNLSFYWSARAPRISPYLDHLWTLAIEEQFYLVWPAVAIRLGRRRLIPVSLGLLAASLAARMSGVNWWLLLARADGFALGGLLAALLSDGGLVERRRKALLSGFGLAVAVGLAGVTLAAALGALPGPRVTPTARQSPAITAFCLAFFGIVGLVVLHAGRPMLAFLRRPRLRRIGMISYGLYLYHFIIFMAGNDIAASLGMGGRPVWRDALMVVATFGLAALSWQYVERPILGLKDRFQYRRSGPE